MSADAVEALAFFLGIASTAWALAYAWGKWLSHRYDAAKAPTVAPSLDAERIARLELAVEALAVELERIGEGQRYTVKLLEERLPRAITAGRSAEPSESGRVVTPH